MLDTHLYMLSRHWTYEFGVHVGGLVISDVLCIIENSSHEYMMTSLSVVEYHERKFGRMGTKDLDSSLNSMTDW